jgi:hypothetical protein
MEESRGAHVPVQATARYPFSISRVPRGPADHSTARPRHDGVTRIRVSGQIVKQLGKRMRCELYGCRHAKKQPI